MLSPGPPNGIQHRVGWSDLLKLEEVCSLKAGLVGLVLQREERSPRRAVAVFPVTGGGVNDGGSTGLHVEGLPGGVRETRVVRRRKRRRSWRIGRFAACQYSNIGLL